MESKFVNIKGLNYHYLEVPNSKKPKLLLVHGVIVESHYWEKVMRELQKDFHLYAIDLKGHGKSDDGRSYLEDYTTETMANDLYVFYQKVIQEPFFLAGYSLGGQFSIDYASEHPDTLKGLAIVDSAPSLPFKGLLALLTADLVTPKIFRTLDEVREFYGNRGFDNLGDYMASYAVKQREEDGKWILRFDKKNISPKSLTEGMRRNRHLWRCLKRIKLPTLILKAAKSKIVNERSLALMKITLPHAETVIISDSGHEFVFTRPAEVARALKDFFSKQKS